jgi:hypothetical protein
MVVYDEIISWKNPGADVESRCRIRIIDLKAQGQVISLKKYYIIASDLGSGAGTSITNSAGFLIPWVCDGRRIDMNEMVWFENYPDNPSLDVAMPKPSSGGCSKGCCLQRVDVSWRPARDNEVANVKQFIPDILEN